MAWFETNRVDCVFGLARNARLVEEIAIDLAWAKKEATRTVTPARRCRDIWWSTLDGWSRRRRVVGTVEWARGEANPPRFAVTSLKPAEANARNLYQRISCARSKMENRIKECQLNPFACRASAATMRANPLRLWFASMAYVLLCALRRIGLAHTQFAEATCGTLRLALIKTGAQVRRSVRGIKVPCLGKPVPRRVRPRPCAIGRRCGTLTTQTPQGAFVSKYRCPAGSDEPARPPQAAATDQTTSTRRSRPFAASYPNTGMPW